MREALKLALEVLKKSKSDNLAKDVERRKAIAAAEEALAQPEQRTWFWLTDKEERQIKEHCTTVACVLKTVKAKLKEKNHG